MSNNLPAHTLASDEEHARLDYLHDCGRCRTVRLAGAPPSRQLVPPAASAAVLTVAIGVGALASPAGVAIAQTTAPAPSQPAPAEPAPAPPSDTAPAPAPPAEQPPDPEPPSPPTSAPDESDEPGRYDVPDLDAIIRDLDTDDSANPDADQGDEGPDQPVPLDALPPTATPAPSNDAAPENPGAPDSEPPTTNPSAPSSTPAPTAPTAPATPETTPQPGINDLAPQDPKRADEPRRPKQINHRSPSRRALPNTPAPPVAAPVPAVTPVATTSTSVQATPTASSATSHTEPATSELQPIRGHTYTTVDGDNLETIALRIYLPRRFDPDSPEYATVIRLRDKIYRMNRDRIGDDPNKLAIGVELRLP